MASKGQKFCKYTNDLKEKVMVDIKCGMSHKAISSKYNISKGTIDTWSHKFNRPDLYPGQGLKRGRPKEKDLTKEDYKQRYEILKKYQAFLKAQRERK